MARFFQSFIQCDFAIGMKFYQDSYPGDTENTRIVISVQAGTHRKVVPITVTCIVDTGAPWCVFAPELLESLNIEELDTYTPEIPLRVRGHKFNGKLVRIPISLLADKGKDLLIEATVFVPKLKPNQEWAFPNFIGLDGFLSRIRFAVDPEDNTFYFGPL